MRATALLISFVGSRVVLPPTESIWRGSSGTWLDSNAYDSSFAACAQESVWDYSSLSSLSAPTAGTWQYDQYTALMDIYTAAGGPDWRSRDSWGVGNPCFQNWYGVSCDCSGKVTKLQLSDNRLIGSLHSSIGSLTDLQEIDLHSTTPLVHSILDGNRNDLAGPIPTLASLSQLRVLDVSYNSFTSFPADIGSNTALEVLVATGNKLTELPTNFRALTRLRVFELADNGIVDTFSVADICQLPDIYVLDFGNNTISGAGFDACLSNLNPLVFDLSAPNPGSLGSGNTLSGSVPASMTTSWTNIKDGYVSFYLQFGISGHFASTCIDLRFCRWFNFGGQDDMAWIGDGSSVPQIVFETIAKAVEY
jgi:hypothetical protein